MKEFFKKAWKGLKFAFSATIGLPVACAATCILGVAYLLAEATNIVEAKVRKDIFGAKQVAKSPFFESVAKGLKSTLKSVWKDYGVYAHLALFEKAFSKTERQELYDPLDNDTEIVTNSITEIPVEKPKENLVIQKKVEQQQLLNQQSEEILDLEPAEDLAQQNQEPSIKDTKETLSPNITKGPSILKNEDKDLAKTLEPTLMTTSEPKIPQDSKNNIYPDIVTQSLKPSQENFQSSSEPSPSPKVISATEVEPQNNQQVLPQ